MCVWERRRKIRMNQSEEGNRYSEREMERVAESIKRQEQRIRKQEAKAVQNLNLYFIFQAIILGSSSLANSCHNWWIPIALSLLAAVANLVSLWAETSKILKWREEVDQNTSDLAFMKVHRLISGHQGGEIVRPKAEKKWKRRLVASLSMGLFASFSAIVMYGCHRILCHPKCVNLC